MRGLAGGDSRPDDKSSSDTRRFRCGLRSFFCLPSEGARRSGSGVISLALTGNVAAAAVADNEDADDELGAGAALGSSAISSSSS